LITKEKLRLWKKQSKVPLGILFIFGLSSAVAGWVGFIVVALIIIALMVFICAWRVWNWFWDRLPENDEEVLKRKLANQKEKKKKHHLKAYEGTPFKIVEDPARNMRKK